MGGPAIIDKLRKLIHTFNVIGAEIRALLLTLARWMDETKQCKQDEICRKIKYELNEEIRQGKITGRWIEECLPAEYKRGYTKSEVSSLSGNSELLLGGTTGLKKDSGSNDQKATAISENDWSTEDILSEYEKAVEKQSPYTEAVENSIEFIIPRKKYRDLNVAMQESKDSIRIAFKNRIFQYVAPDTAGLSA